MTRSRLLPDNFTLTLIGVVLLASFLPASGQVAIGFGWLTNIAIGLLFFLHGAKLSREAIIAGAGHWRLHLLVFSLTFILFPVLGLALKPLLSPLVGRLVDRKGPALLIKTGLLLFVLSALLQAGFDGQTSLPYLCLLYTSPSPRDS